MRRVEITYSIDEAPTLDVRGTGRIRVGVVDRIEVPTSIGRKIADDVLAWIDELP